MTTAPPLHTTDSETWALWYAEALGWPVGPLYELRADGSCSCYLKSACTHAGKHPITEVCPHGSLDYTTDPEKIRGMWRKHPRAGIGSDLGRMGLVDISSDSFKWLWEFEDRGLPPTLTFQSSGDANRHHLYKRGEDCPTHRISEPKEFDLLSSGNVVLPPSPYAVGKHRVWLSDDLTIDPPETPAWAAAQLREAAAKSAAANTSNGAISIDTPHGEETEEPPLPLDTYGREVWAGKHPVRHPDGTIDQSDSIYKLCAEMYDGGLASWLIAGTVAARAKALGWTKYAKRPGEYQRIVNKLKLKPRAPRTSIIDDTKDDNPGSDAPCAATVAAKDAEITMLHGVIDTQRRRIQEQDQQLAAYRQRDLARAAMRKNPTLKPAEKFAAEGIIERASARTADSDGWTDISMQDTARDLGVTPTQLCAVTKRLKVLGVLEKRTTSRERVAVVDKDGNPKIDIRTGLPRTRPIPVVQIRLPGSASDTYQQIGAMEIPEDKRAEAVDLGKKQNRCPLHPDAGTAWREHCNECDEVLDWKDGTPAADGYERPNQGIPDSSDFASSAPPVGAASIHAGIPDSSAGAPAQLLPRDKPRYGATRRCSDCGVELERTVTSARCDGCWEAMVGAAPSPDTVEPKVTADGRRVCDEPGCDVVLERGNYIGTCPQHRKAVPPVGVAGLALAGGAE